LFLFYTPSPLGGMAYGNLFNYSKKLNFL